MNKASSKRNHGGGTRNAHNAQTSRHPHTHTFTLSFTRFLTFSVLLSLSLPLTFTHKGSFQNGIIGAEKGMLTMHKHPSPTHTLSLTNTHTFSLSLSLSPSLSLTLTFTHKGSLQNGITVTKRGMLTMYKCHVIRSQKIGLLCAGSCSTIHVTESIIREGWSNGVSFFFFGHTHLCLGSCTTIRVTKSAMA